jgi:hypothetical protein
MHYSGIRLERLRKIKRALSEDSWVEISTGYAQNTSYLIIAVHRSARSGAEIESLRHLTNIDCSSTKTELRGL